MNKIVKLIYQSVINNKNIVAYKNQFDSITYQELWEKSSYYGSLLKKEGTGPVIIYGDKELDMVISILSCLIANRAYIPINNKTPLKRIESIINLTNSKLILSKELITINNYQSITLEELSQYQDNKEINNNQDIAYIIFTSGSTGNPKGVPISYDNLSNFIKWISNFPALKDYHNSKVLNQASFSFDLSVADLYYSLCNGHTLVAYSNQTSTNEIYEIIKKEHIEIMVLTPTFIKLLLLNQDFNSLEYPYLKCLYFCGETLEPSTVHKLINHFPNIKIINAYGPTEATSAISGILITKDILKSDEILPVGNINNLATKVTIIDNEIVLKGPSVFNRYLNLDSPDHYLEDNINCYKTKDLGYIQNNKLYCKGRKDNQIKYKGYRIELSDIENNLSKIEGITSCAVIAKYNEQNIVKTIKAFIVLEKDISIDIIKKELNKLLPDYMIPKSFTILDQMPINNNGKIDRKALSEL